MRRHSLLTTFGALLALTPPGPSAPSRGNPECAKTLEDVYGIADYEHAQAD